MDKSSFLHSDITNKIIHAFYTAYNRLDFGFLEKVYENSLVIELNKIGLNCRKQQPIAVYYEKYKVGLYYADIIVDEKVIIELKAAESICDEHEAQLLNYLKASEIETGLILNFGIQPQIKRKVFSNQFKTNKKKEI